MEPHSTAAFLLSFVMFSSVGGAQGVTTVPETGQAASYDSSTPQRDDGGLRAGVVWPNPRFTDNGDGTRTDNLTGLIWLEHAACFTAQQWQGALTVVVQLNSGTDFGCIDYAAGSFADWRLPNLDELESLVNAGATNQAIWLTGDGFLTVIGDDYFSSTTYFGTTHAWGIDFLRGYPTVIPKTSYRYLWPVRGQTSSPAALPRTGQIVSFDTNNPQRDDGALREGVAWPAPRFVTNGDGTIDDGLNGLTWLEDANCIASQYPGFDADGTAGDGAVNWQHALDFAAGVNAGTFPECSGGFTDWRLANRKELFSLFDPSQNNPSLPSDHPFTNVMTENYWTSTTEASITVTAWTIELRNGFWGWYDKVPGAHFVWLVRGGVDIFDDGFESGDLIAWSSSEL